MENNQPGSSKNIYLFVFLASLLVANALIAEFVGVKIFSVEKIFHLNPLNLPFIGGSNLSLNMSVGVLMWPVVFILSDIINEYYGRRGVRRISFITAGMIAYAFIIIYAATKAPPADFWLKNNANDLNGNPFNIDYAFGLIFRQGLGMIIGSITAFLVGQLVDAYTFHYLRNITRHRKLWLRATGSTVVSQLFDSFLVLFIAFYLLGNWSFIEVISVGVIQYIYKISLAIILTPVIYGMHYLIDRYLGSQKSTLMIEKASVL
jgi:queuosine precursor transporter